MEPEIGGVYKDSGGRKLVVQAVHSADRLGRDVQGHITSNDHPEPAPYATSIGIFRATWTEKIA